MLRQIEQLFGALGVELDETMWTEAAKRLDEVLEVLKRPSDFYLEVKKHEEAELQRELAALERARAAREELLRRLPKKVQAWVKWPIRRRA